MKQTKFISILAGIGVLAVGISPGYASTPLAAGKITSRIQRVAASGKTFSVKVVDVPLGSSQVKVGLAEQRVGRTEPMSGIVRRYRATAGINGSFFQAYTSNPIKNPNHVLISGGDYLHLSRVGCVMGFAPGSKPVLSRLSPKITGTLEGGGSGPKSWYAYWINRYPENQTTATLFDRYWAQNTTPAGGTQVVVRDEIVKEINHQKNGIPKDGYVLYFRGGEESMASRFQVGQHCKVHIELYPDDDDELWNHVTEAIGGGPTLVRDGVLDVDPSAEGFNDRKILSMSAARSAIGVTPSGHLLMITCSAATIPQLAHIMKNLGCWDAMNLDGGASSVLWYKGKYLTTPGREMSNTLLAFE
jgi:exopolysaccharide biosynthesis protein